MSRKASDLTTPFSEGGDREFLGIKRKSTNEFMIKEKSPKKLNSLNDSILDSKIDIEKFKNSKGVSADRKK